MTCKQAIERSLQSVESKSTGKNEWGRAHFNAWYAGHVAETPIANLFTALAHYADDHTRRFDSPLGVDRDLGFAWLEMMKQLGVLLNGELGRLDGGTLDHLRYDMAEAAGFDRKELEQ